MTGGEREHWCSHAQQHLIRKWGKSIVFSDKQMACTSENLVVIGDLKYLDLLGKIISGHEVG